MSTALSHFLPCSIHLGECWHFTLNNRSNERYSPYKLLSFKPIPPHFFRNQIHLIVFVWEPSRREKSPAVVGMCSCDFFMPKNCLAKAPLTSKATWSLTKETPGPMGFHSPRDLGGLTQRDPEHLGGSLVGSYLSNRIYITSGTALKRIDQFRMFCWR